MGAGVGVGVLCVCACVCVRVRTCVWVLVGLPTQHLNRNPLTATPLTHFQPFNRPPFPPLPPQIKSLMSMGGGRITEHKLTMMLREWVDAQVNAASPAPTQCIYIDQVDHNGGPAGQSTHDCDKVFYSLQRGVHFAPAAVAVTHGSASASCACSSSDSTAAGSKGRGKGESLAMFGGDEGDLASGSNGDYEDDGDSDDNDNNCSDMGVSGDGGATAVTGTGKGKGKGKGKGQSQGQGKGENTGLASNTQCTTEQYFGLVSTSMSTLSKGHRCIHALTMLRDRRLQAATAASAAAKGSSSASTSSSSTSSSSSSSSSSSASSSSSSSSSSSTSSSSFSIELAHVPSAEQKENDVVVVAASAIEWAQKVAMKAREKLKAAVRDKIQRDEEVEAATQREAMGGLETHVTAVMSRGAESFVPALASLSMTLAQR